VTAALRLVPWAGTTGVGPALAPAAERTVATLTEIHRPAPWGCYLAWAGADLVGVCAFKAAPDGEGTVEIAYSTFPPHEGRGHATAMIGALVGMACASGAAVVIAHTRPAMNASAHALARNDFVRADAFVDPDDGPVWYWERVLERDGRASGCAMT
jgi:ribosomal-protein-alanine N-acetyltransferase